VPKHFANKADCLRVIDVGIDIYDLYVEAAAALILDNPNNNFRICGRGSVALFGLMREFTNALGYQVI
jgi:hypothetical protein